MEEKEFDILIDFIKKHSDYYPEIPLSPKDYSSILSTGCDEGYKIILEGIFSSAISALDKLSQSQRDSLMDKLGEMILDTEDHGYHLDPYIGDDVDYETYREEAVKTHKVWENSRRAAKSDE